MCDGGDRLQGLRQRAVFGCYQKQVGAADIGYNLPQAILGVGVGAYRDSIHVKNLMEQLIDEVTAVAAAKGGRFFILKFSLIFFFQRFDCVIRRQSP